MSIGARIRGKGRLFEFGRPNKIVYDYTGTAHSNWLFAGFRKQLKCVDQMADTGIGSCSAGHSPSLARRRWQRMFEDLNRDELTRRATERLPDRVVATLNARGERRMVTHGETLYRNTLRRQFQANAATRRSALPPGNDRYRESWRTAPGSTAEIGDLPLSGEKGPLDRVELFALSRTFATRAVTRSRRRRHTCVCAAMAVWGQHEAI